MNIAISKDGTKIAYDKSGHGPALVMVAGAFSYRKFPGQIELANRLAEKHTVYNYDRRGRGDSGDSQTYAVEREIEDLEAIIDAAGGSANVYGLSSGAVLALQAAARGLNITRLVLHEPPFVVDPADHKTPTDFVEHVRELIASDRRSEAVKYFMIQGMGVPSFVIPMMRMMPGVWSRLMSVAHTLPYDAALLEGFMEGKPLSKDQWPGVTMPTLILEGIESPISLRHGARALDDVLSNAHLRSKKGLGHTKKLNAKMISSEITPFFAGA
ncbi:alpha/beta fold hydrolase [Paenibacillus sp. HJL G12]|uniref:Alpha/beta fold hydrolase n=1 Tax=Paenibacillus dendrobii TaxID=2691084 RepID=A0A7X3IIS7_9BACL|nr:alpha/beta hydrolase [Paenibacillus dendrobii]MWV42827.1 alpha/beta fold hydrolase [Paenibacillus dendrobii]